MEISARCGGAVACSILEGLYFCLKANHENATALRRLRRQHDKVLRAYTGGCEVNIGYWRTQSYAEWLAETWVQFVVFNIEYHYCGQPEDVK